MKTILNTTVVRSPLIASCVALSALIGACASTPIAGSRNVTIQRTTFGIAHITAPDWEGIAYGTAYAHAQDNVCQTADHLLTIRGERSKFLGGSAQGLLGLRPLPNEQIDAVVRGSHQRVARDGHARGNHRGTAPLAEDGRRHRDRIRLPVS